jgi:hypothetical protein
MSTAGAAPQGLLSCFLQPGNFLRPGQQRGLREHFAELATAELGCFDKLFFSQQGNQEKRKRGTDYEKVKMFVPV